MTEQLSALADNELDLADAEHLLTSLQANGSAAEAWGRYHLIGDVMRGTPALSADFKSKLMAKIEAEPTVLSPNAAGFKSATNPQGSAANHPVWAIAASFAAILVVGFMVLQAQVGEPALSTNVATADSDSLAIPAEYLMAHQSSAPSASSYYIQSASYTH